MRNFLQLVVKVVLLIGCLFYSPEANAATINAASCSRTDVVTAMGQAADGTSTTIGDTVIIPACTTTAWASPIVVTKRITIQGQGTTAGSSLTSLGTNQAFVIKLTTDGPVRITAIAMARSSWGSSDTMVEIIGSNHNGVGTYMSKARVDHCKFTNGGRQITVTGRVEGVLDHNTHINANIAVGFAGDNTLSWGRPIVAGSANSMFIEDNTFVVDNNRLIGGGGNANNEQIYHQEGARSVIRHNTFNFTQTNDVTAVIDTHGNDFSYYDGTSTSFRGNPLIELYKNTVTSTGNWFYWLHLRGGSVLSHDNTITVATGSPTYIKLHEYETTCCTPARSIWPAQDQVFNSFFWNETLNGNAVTAGDFEYYNAATQPLNVQDRDYFLHAPQASGGKECFVTPGETSNCANKGRAGGSTAPPTTGDTGTMIFVASGANAYYPYTPYVYPHPLVNGTSGSLDISPPSIPTNLRVQ